MKPLISTNVLVTKPLLIGLTGGIGSGKTAFAQCLRALGQPVYCSDTEAKNLVYLPQVQAEIMALLGPEAYQNGQYQRAFVGQKVFADAQLLAQLNAIVHPAVAQHFAQWQTQQAEARFLFKETALLFELGLHQKLDYSVLITASQEIRLARVMARDQRSETEIKQIMAKQMPEAQKIALADLVIYNESSLAHLQQQAEQLLQTLSTFKRF
jgi:dephospho-CoA kinase